MLEDLINNIDAGFEAVTTGIATLIDSLYNLVKWLPTVINVYVSSSAFIPSAFVGVAVASIAIFLIKVLLGGSND